VCLLSVNSLSRSKDFSRCVVASSAVTKRHIVCMCDVLQAKELSSLTGAQVLLIVTSETGNIYDFSTPKFSKVLETFKTWYRSSLKDAQRIEVVHLYLHTLVPAYSACCICMQMSKMFKGARGIFPSVLRGFVACAGYAAAR